MKKLENKGFDEVFSDEGKSAIDERSNDDYS